MSGSREISPFNAFDELGARVSLEYADCSIAAAEANKAAHEIITSRNNLVHSNRTSYYLISKDKGPNDAQVLDAVVLGKTLNHDYEAVSLVVIQYHSSYTVTKKKGILRRAVKLITSESEGDPILAARIGEDSYLPLASFSQREENDHCAYVQIGSEMADETVVMTPLDEDTSRHDIVESIRNLFNETNLIRSRSVIQDEKSRQILQKLFDELLLTHAEQTASSSEAMLVRRSFEKVRENTKAKKLNILSANGSTFTQDLWVASLLESVQLSDSRVMDLMLAEESKDLKNDQYVQLLAVTRGSVALPIAKMYKETGTVVFDTDKSDSNGDARQLIINELLARVRGLPIVDPNSYTTPANYGLRKRYSPTEIEPDWRKIDQNKLNYYDTICATYFYEKGLLRKDEGALKNGRYDTSGMTKMGVDRIYADFDAYFKDPEYTEIPNSNLAPVRLALSRLPLKRQAEQDFLNLFEVEASLKSKLGDTSIEEERLALQIDKMLLKSNQFLGLIEEVNTGNTKGDIEIKATIENTGTKYRVNIYAKPRAMLNQAFSATPQMQLYFDASRPMFNRNEKETSDVSAKARRYYEILKVLQPVT
jgi:hypothetical protein